MPDTYLVTAQTIRGGGIVARAGQSVTRETFEFLDDRQFAQLVTGGAIKPYDVPQPAVAEAPGEGEQPPAGSLSMTPGAQRVIEEYGLDPAQITGTGEGGRITKPDVDAFLEAQTAAAGTEG